MRRIVSAITALLMLVSLFPPAIHAEEFSEYTMFYNFSDYMAEMKSGDTPGADWQTGRSKVNYGSTVDEGTKSRVLAVGKDAEPMVGIGKTIDSGNLHISFDVRRDENPESKVLMAFYNATANSDYNTYEIEQTRYSRVFSLNKSPISYYTTGKKAGDDMHSNSWATRTTDKEINDTKWHKIDLVFNDFDKGASATANYYLDGELITDMPVYYGLSKGFKYFFLRGENNGGSGYWYLDNMYIHNYQGSESLYAKPENDKIKADGAEISLSFSEILNKVPSKSDIVIKNARTGASVTNFEVTAATNTSVSVKVNGTIPNGQYSVMTNDNITGLVSKAPMKEAALVKTETEYVTIFGDKYYEDNFNSYTSTDTKTLPAGWSDIKYENPTNVAPAAGQKGSNDYAFAIQGNDSATKRYIKVFDNPIPANTEFIVSFDIYCENTGWELGLLEPEDAIKDDNSNYEKTLAIGQMMTGQSGWRIVAAPKVGYDTERSAYGFRGTFVNNEVSASDDNYYANMPLGQWHSVKLTVKPTSETKAEYKLNIDGAESTYTGANISRSFGSKATAGISITSRPPGDGTENSDVRIDNILVCTEKKIPRPDVEKVSYYTYDGRVQNIKSGLSSATEKIVIEFNTEVSDIDILDNVLLSKNGDKCVYTYKFDESDRKKLEIYPEGMLKPGAAYTLTVKTGIASVEDDSLKPEFEYTDKFNVISDAMYLTLTDGVKNNEGSYTFPVDIIKTNDEAHSYIHAIASFKKHTITLPDGTQKEFLEMKDIEKSSAEITEDSFGRTKIGYEAILSPGEADVVKGYLWETPNNISVLN